MDGEKYMYKEIYAIIFKSDVKYINGVKIRHNIEMGLTFMDMDYIPFPITDKHLTGIAQFNYQRGLISTNTKLGSIVEFMYEYLQNKTFEQRLNRVLKTLEKYDKFCFWENLPIFSNNGNLYNSNGKLEGNLKVMHEKGRIIDGEKYGSYKNKVINPYVYGFERESKFFGLVSDNVEFGNTVNRDIMYKLFDNLYKTGKMSGNY